MFGEKNLTLKKNTPNALLFPLVVCLSQLVTLYSNELLCNYCNKNKSSNNPWESCLIGELTYFLLIIIKPKTKLLLLLAYSCYL